MQAAIRSVWRGAAAAAVQGARACSTVVTDITERVHVPSHVPAPLSKNMHDLHLLISDTQVMHHVKELERNQSSFQTLRHFLEAYSKGLCKDTPLAAQRHTLDDGRQSAGLRRVVVTVGTTGGSSSHRLVHRAMQALFKEVGLSPNFVWDNQYSIPEEMMSAEQRQALDEARLDSTVESIRAVQAGGELPANSGLTAVTAGSEADAPAEVQRVLEQQGLAVPKPRAGAAQVQAVQPAGGQATGDHIAAEEADEAASSVEEQHKQLLHLSATVDEHLGLMAMSPYMRMYGEKRRAQEVSFAEETLVFLSGVLPGLGLAVQDVWDGARDARRLKEELQAANDPAEAQYAEACVIQLLSCAQALEVEFGLPDEQQVVPRKQLIRCVSEFGAVREYMETLLADDKETTV